MTLRELRLSRGYEFLNDIAKKCDITKQHLSYLEQKIKKPSLTTANKLAKALGVSLDEINRCFENQKTAQADG